MAENSAPGYLPAGSETALRLGLGALLGPPSEGQIPVVSSKKARLRVPTAVSRERDQPGTAIRAALTKRRIHD